MIFTILFARSLICSASSNLLMISSSVFFISIINVFFSSNCLIFYLCWISHCIHIVFSRVQGVSLWSLLWTLYLVNCLSPFHSLFFEDLSCSFIWKASFSLLILFNSLPSLSLSLFSYILGTSGPSPILERRTMCKKWDTPWQLEPGVLSAFPLWAARALRLGSGCISVGLLMGGFDPSPTGHEAQCDPCGPVGFSLQASCRVRRG